MTDLPPPPANGTEQVENLGEYLSPEDLHDLITAIREVTDNGQGSIELIYVDGHLVGIDTSKRKRTRR